jgi:hypothetical protein
MLPDIDTLTAEDRSKTRRLAQCEIAPRHNSESFRNLSATDPAPIGENSHFAGFAS